MKLEIKSILPYIAALVTFIAVACIFFAPQIEGKVLNMGDIVSNRGMAQEVRQYKKETGDVSLWTNSMFGGMPTYQISSPQQNNLIKKISKVLSLGFDSPLGKFLMGMICFFIALTFFGVSPWVAIAMSVAFAFSTVNIVHIEAGHTSKVYTVMAAAPILVGMIRATEGQYIKGGALFAFFLAMAIGFNHLQMVYYLAFFCAIYMIIKFVDALKKGELVTYGKAVGVLSVGALLALGTFSAKFLVTNEYAKDTMRGKPILETTGEVTSSSETDGLEWEYAMQYSHNILDVIASTIPRAAGGSSAEVVGKDSEFAKAVRSRKATPAPLYFGGLPPTAGVFYFGALIMFLFLMGSTLVRGPVKWWLVGVVLISFLMSMGKNASFLNKALFDYFPYFNKFRSPNSVMEVTSLFIPFLGALGLHRIFTTENKNELLKPLLYVVGGLGGFVLLYDLIGPSIVTLDGPSDGAYAQYPGVVEALVADRASYMRSSAFRSLLFILIGAGSVYAFIKGWINKYLLVGIIGLASFLDLFGVDKRYLSAEDFYSERRYKANFAPRPVDNQILKDNDPHYRVHDLTVNTFNSASGAYHHKMIGGYSAAKLQRFEDVKVRHLEKGNQAVLNMLNAKYIIVPGNDGKPFAQRNPAALGNAWFVSDIKKVATANDEIDALTGLDPRITAVVHNEFSTYVEGLDPQSNGSITLTEYKPNKLTYSVNGNGDRLAVFSEVWYGPDKGWNAYIDGSKVDHIRVNYLLRALKVPAGAKEIVFEFDPPLYKKGEMLSLISSILILLFGLFAIYNEWIRKK